MYILKLTGDHVENGLELANGLERTWETGADELVETEWPLDVNRFLFSLENESQHILFLLTSVSAFLLVPLI